MCFVLSQCGIYGCWVGRNADIYNWTRKRTISVWWRRTDNTVYIWTRKGKWVYVFSCSRLWFPGVVLFSVTSLQSERILNSSEECRCPIDGYRWESVDFALALNLWFQCLLCRLINTSVYSFGFGYRSARAPPF